MDATLLKKLNSAKAAFKNARTNVAESKSGDFFVPEPGRKTVQITDAEVNESQSGRLQCFFELTIMEGEEKGETFRKYYGLDEKGMEFLLKDMQRLERDLPDDISLLDDTLQQIVKDRLMLNIRVKEKGEFLNTYFDKLLKDGDRPASEPVEPKAAQQPAATPPEPEAAPAAPAPAPQAQEEQGGEIAIGQDLMVEGEGVGTVTGIDEKNGTVQLFVTDKKKMVTVGVDKLSLVPAEAPAPSAMRVTKK